MATKRLIEVERKFCSTGPATFLASGDPPFKSFVHHGSQIFNDKYFDRGNLLRSAGIYIRQRNKCWEAKVKRGGDYLNSQFEETTSVSKIATYARKSAGVQKMANAKNNFYLDVVADLTTTRQSWTADGKFRIVLDNTDFGHTVGEVELEKEVNTRAGSKNDVRCLTEMNQEIVDFLTMYSWAFPPGEPKGKLTAYFELQQTALHVASDVSKVSPRSDMPR